MDEFKLQGRTIYKAARETKHDDGSSSFTLGFPVCEVSEWIKEPEQVLDILNSHDSLQAKIAERDETIELLREGSADDLRSTGLVVAVHNDYVLHGQPHTFWLFTAPDGRYYKGEGMTDAEALNQVRAALKENADDTNA